MCSFNIFFGPKWLSSHPNKKARWTSGQFVFKSEGARLALCVCRDTQPYLLSTSDHQMRMTNPDHLPKISHWHQTKTAQSFQKSLTQTNNMICLSYFHLVSCQISPASRRHPTALQMQNWSCRSRRSSMRNFCPLKPASLAANVWSKASRATRLVYILASRCSADALL